LKKNDKKLRDNLYRIEKVRTFALAFAQKAVSTEERVL
jgi:hypothetical protein